MPGSKEETVALGSCPTVVYLAFFIFTLAFVQSAFYSSGILIYYTKWGLSLSFLINGGLLGNLAYFYTQLKVSEYCDQNKIERWGRRKPFVIVSGIIQAISILFALIPIGNHRYFINIWFVIWQILFNIGAGIGQNPYSAWIIESSADDDDFRFLQSVVFPLSGFCGGLLGILLTLALPTPAGIIGAVLISVGTAGLVYNVHNTVIRVSEKVPPLVPSLRLAMRTMEFRIIFGNKTLITSAVSVVGQATLYLLSFNFNTVTRDQQVANIQLYSIVAGAFVGIIILNTSLNWILKTKEKIFLYRRSMLSVAVACFGAFLASLGSSQLALIIFVFFQTYILMIYFPVQMVDNLFIRDLILYDTFLTNINRENMYFTAISLPPAVISLAISGFVLAIINQSGIKILSSDDDHIASQAEWNNTVIWMCRFFGCVVSGMIALASFTIMKDYALTSDVARSIEKKSKAESTGEVEEKDTERPILQQQGGKDSTKEERESTTKAIDGVSSTADKNTEGADATATATASVAESSRSTKNTEGGGTGTDSFTNTVSTVKNNVDEDQMWLLLHMSVDELRKIAFSTIDGTLETLVELRWHNRITFWSSLFCCVLIVVSTVMDITYNRSRWTTLLISLLVLMGSLSLYEEYRRTAMKLLLLEPPHTVKDACRMVVKEAFDDFHIHSKAKFDAFLIELKQGGDDEGDEILDSILGKPTRKSLLEPFELSASSSDIEQSTKTTMGYKRVYFSVAAVVVFCVVITTLGTQN